MWEMRKRLLWISSTNHVQLTTGRLMNVQISRIKVKQIIIRKIILTWESKSLKLEFLGCKVIMIVTKGFGNSRHCTWPIKFKLHNHPVKYAMLLSTFRKVNKRRLDYAICSNCTASKWGKPRLILSCQVPCLFYNI